MVAVKRMLKPGGWAVIDVPNINDVRRILFKQDWPQFRKHHLWYFSKHTIEILVEKYGLKIVGIEPHGGSQIVYTLDKKLNINAGSFIAKYFKYFRPVRRAALRILNNIGFSEDIKIYAKNINC
jgi:hypothetical protein